MLDYKEYVNNASQNLHRYLLCLLVPFLLAACSREPEFDRNFKKSCEATSYGKTSYCECALGIVKRNIKGDALLTMSTKDLEPLAPKFSEPARQNNQDEAIKTHISIQEMQAFNLARRRFEKPYSDGNQDQAIPLSTKCRGGQPLQQSTCPIDMADQQTKTTHPQAQIAENPQSRGGDAGFILPGRSPDKFLVPTARLELAQLSPLPLKIACLPISPRRRGHAFCSLPQTRRLAPAIRMPSWRLS